MENEMYVGRGWKNQFNGIKITIKLEDIQKLPVNRYGDVELYVGERKQMDEKSKATHFVKYRPQQNQPSNDDISKFIKQNPNVNQLVDELGMKNDGLPF